MRKVLAVCGVLLMGGCQAVKESVGEAKDTLMNPPNEVWQAVLKLIDWAFWLLTNFLGDVGAKIGL